MSKANFEKNINLDKLERYQINLWLDRKKIKQELGLQLDFYDHLYLFDIYDDFAPKQCCLKAAQICFSTMAIIKTLFIAKNMGLDIIYTLPTAGDIYDFVGGKVNRIIAQNPVFREYVKDRDTFEQKRVGDNLIYYRGTFTQRAALMVSSDLNVYDEYDRSDQKVIQQYGSRLQHSRYKWEWMFSNPSVQGHGVSRFWPSSDQKHWFIKCSHCNKRQYLSWPESINYEKKIYICKYCGKELTREDRRVGEWVKKLNQAEWSGYWISLLMAPWTSAAEIIQYHQEKSEEYFYNFVLGLPYVGEGNIVVPDMIYRNLTSEINNQERVVIGCDSGIKKHYVLGNRQGLFYYGVTEDWDDIARLLKRYEQSIAVIDSMPDITGPRKLKELFPGRVFLVHYGKDRKTLQMVRWGENKEYGNVVIDRNRMIQLVIEEFVDKRIPLQGRMHDWQDYYNHWETLYRINDVDGTGMPTIKWESSTGQDHWCLATVYWRTGMDKFGGGQAEFVGGDKPKPVSAPEIVPGGDIVGRFPKTIIYPEPSEPIDWREVK